MNFNFTSQICTSRDQSERLLALGLKKGTADCILVENPFKPNNYVMFPIVDVDETLENEMNSEPIPAWSLHRLIELLGLSKMIFNMDLYDSPYEEIIRRIDIYINTGVFNREYLEE
jgi:hypothetical protein